MDLAVIELCQSVVEQLLVTNRFVGIAEIDLLAYAQPAFYLILGFPSEDTEVNYIERDIKTKGLWYVTFLYRGKLNPHSNFNPDIHLLLNFEKTGLAHDGETSKIPHPRGLSGCGIWRLTESESWENWKPEHMKLVAIQHRYDEHRNYVMGSWVRHAMQMVWHRYKELRPGMQIQIPQSG
ncbi:MAG: hypothetical protein ABSE63_12425 [Thermoguttaceae bacterium]